MPGETAPAYPRRPGRSRSGRCPRSSVRSLEAFGHLRGTDRGDGYAAYSVQVMRGMGFAGTPNVDGLALAAS